MVNGFDPLQYLKAEGPDVIVLNRVITRAQELAAERKKNEIEALGAVIARNLAKLWR